MPNTKVVPPYPFLLAFLWGSSVILGILCIQVQNPLVLKALTRHFEYWFLLANAAASVISAVVIIPFELINAYVGCSLFTFLVISYDARPSPMLISESVYKWRPILGLIFFILGGAEMLILSSLASTRWPDRVAAIGPWEFSVKSIFHNSTLTVMIFSVKFFVKALQGKLLILKFDMPVSALKQPFDSSAELAFRHLDSFASAAKHDLDERMLSSGVNKIRSPSSSLRPKGAPHRFSHDGYVPLLESSSESEQPMLDAHTHTTTSISSPTTSVTSTHTEQSRSVSETPTTPTTPIRSVPVSPSMSTHGHPYANAANTAVPVVGMVDEQNPRPPSSSSSLSSSSFLHSNSNSNLQDANTAVSSSSQSNPANSNANGWFDITGAES